MIYRPDLGCLIFVLLILAIGGGPLLVGLARVALFFMVASMVAATIGGWWLRRQSARLQSGRSERHRRFVETLVALLVRLAELDGQLDRREVTVIRHFFERDLGYSGDRLLWVRDLIKAARKSTVTVAELCDRIVADFDFQARLIAIEVLARVAQADGAVNAAEEAFLNDVARRLGLAPFLRGYAWQRRFEETRGFEAPRRDTTAEALAVLGLGPGASPEEIKNAWRNLSKENHPDRVTHLGEEFRRVAEERMRRINAAYDELKAAGMVA